jgi:NDP-sugar pyrophosphorylase family protein
MKAGIFAAGMGSRFQEAGWRQPKPLIALHGKPLIAHVLENLFRAGIEEVDLLLNKEPLSDPVDTYVKALPDASRVRVWRKTTRTSYESFCFLMDRIGSPPFLLSTVDTIFPVDALKDFLVIRSYPSSCRLALAVTDRVHDEKPLWVEISEEGKILNMGESVSEKESVTAGLYLVLRELAEPATARPFAALRDFLVDVVEKGGEVWAKRFPMALDIDCPEDIRMAESLLQESRGWAGA